MNIVKLVKQFLILLISIKMESIIMFNCLVWYLSLNGNI